MGCNQHFDAGGPGFNVHWSDECNLVKYQSEKKMVSLEGNAWLFNVHTRRNRFASNSFAFPVWYRANERYGDPDDRYYRGYTDKERRRL